MEAIPRRCLASTEIKNIDSRSLARGLHREWERAQFVSLSCKTIPILPADSKRYKLQLPPSHPLASLLFNALVGSLRIHSLSLYLSLSLCSEIPNTKALVHLVFASPLPSPPLPRRRRLILCSRRRALGHFFTHTHTHRPVRMRALFRQEREASQRSSISARHTRTREDERKRECSVLYLR